MKTEILKSGQSVLNKKPNFSLIAREKELHQMINILSRRSANNVLLTGQGGAGCSTLCLGLQKAKADPHTPFDILNKRLWWLDTDGLFSDPDKLQENFDNVIQKVSNTADQDTILIIEDTRNFIDAVNHSGNGSFINRLIRNIEQKRFQVVFEVRDTDLEMVLNSHGSMPELFTIMEVNPPSPDNLHKILAGACKNLKNHHGIKIENEAIEQAIYLTTTYPGKERSLMRSQPEASLTLIDRALSTYRNESHAEPAELKVIKEKIRLEPSNPALISELENLQAKISVLNNLQYKLGALAVDKNKVLKAYDTVREDLKAIQVELEKTYGRVSINVEDGTLTETEETDEQTDKKD